MLAKEIYRMPIYEYALTKTEKTRLQKFLKVHKSTCPHIESNSLYSICFSPEGGIGVGVTVSCKICGEKKDITDYSTW